jgi:hypothetical protein
MNLIQDFKGYIPVIIITLILGYFLGITVSTVVDYRLKDAVINLPKPRNNIVIKLDQQQLDSLQAKGYVKETFDGSKKISKKIKERFTNPSKKIDSPEPYSEDITNDTDITNVNRELFSIEPTYYLQNRKMYKNSLTDSNRDAYALAYNISKKMSNNSEYDPPYVAANFENLGEQYSTVSPLASNKIDSAESYEVVPDKTIRPAKNMINIKKYKKEFSKTSLIDDMAPIDRRCPNYKRQRLWENSVNKPNIIIKDIKDIKI